VQHIAPYSNFVCADCDDLINRAVIVIKVLEVLTLGASVNRYTPRCVKLLVRMMITSTLTLTACIFSPEASAGQAFGLEAALERWP
jgi:hypothetical protein